MIKRLTIILFAFLVFAQGLVVAQAQSQRGGIFEYRWDNPPPVDLITTVDIQKALIWTGFYNGMADGGFGRLTRAAAIEWQRAHGLAGTGSLSPDQIARLFSEGIHSRDSVKWTFLADSDVGVIVPFPAALTTFVSGRRTRDGIVYSFDGTVNVSVTVVPSISCANFDTFFDVAVRDIGERQVLYKARRDNWFVVSGSNGQNKFYDRAECTSTGTAIFIISVPAGDDKLIAMLFSAFSNGVSVAPTLNVDATPNAMVFPPSSGGALLRSEPQRLPQSNVATTKVDGSGKTSKAKLALASGPELRPQDIFERVRNAVYVVQPDENTLGSAVAISAMELLTNCHVVRDARAVSILHDNRIIPAEIVSRNADADRCVLRTSEPLPSWVNVRPLSDVKVGEHVYTVGAPRGLELTLAEGLVSSKRTIGLNRLIQTSAPISPGSSGGGLFDAWGNLIGITQFLLRDSQNLNFAIAAEDFVQ